jgi:putative copper resistance protein D
VLSGAAWLALLAGQMSERPLGDLWSGDIVSTVLLDTDFGHVWLVRAALTALLAVALHPPYFARFAPPWRRGVALVAAAGLVGALAFTGHAGAGTGTAGFIQQAADALHLLGAASWVGALVPLALVLGAASNRDDPSALAAAREATLRFSTLGVAGVAALLASGIVNTWLLVGSVSALFGSPYGRLVVLKVVLFALMVMVAAVNRLRLTPRLAGRTGTASARHDALRRLRANSLIEAALGAAILFVVGILGTLPPGTEDGEGARTGALGSASPVTGSAFQAWKS